MKYIEINNNIILLYQIRFIKKMRQSETTYILRIKYMDGFEIDLSYKSGKERDHDYLKLFRELKGKDNG